MSGRRVGRMVKNKYYQELNSRGTCGEPRSRIEGIEHYGNDWGQESILFYILFIVVVYF